MSVYYNITLCRLYYVIRVCVVTTFRTRCAPQVSFVSFNRQEIQTSSGPSAEQNGSGWPLLVGELRFTARDRRAGKRGIHLVQLHATRKSKKLFQY